jgi:hypothetical protein
LRKFCVNFIFWTFWDISGIFGIIADKKDSFNYSAPPLKKVQSLLRVQVDLLRSEPKLDRN